VRGRLTAPIPRTLFGLTLVAELMSIALSWGLEPRYDTVLYAVFSVTLAGAGALVASRHPENAVGWLLIGSGLFNAITADLAQGWGLRAAQQGWPAGPAAEALAMTSWLPSGVGLALVFLRFPDGRLLSPRWRVVEIALVLGCVVAVPGWALSPDRASDFVAGHNPLAVETARTGALLAVGSTVFLASFAASAASLLVRLHRARGDERQQLKGFVFAAALAGLLLPVSSVLWDTTPLARVLAAVVLTMLPVVACSMILRHRLYDVDLVVSRTVGYGILTVLLATTYLAAAVTIGARLGRGSAWTTAGATLVAAVAFQPLRERVQDAVDRRFRRAQYDARQRMAAFYDALHRGDLAPEAVEGVLRDVLDDPRLTVLYSLPAFDGNVDGTGTSVQRAAGDLLPVEWDGQRLGVVRCGPLGEQASRMARDLVRSASLALEMSRLRVELREKLTEVEASRSRVVEAAQQERRRIERDLHDGAQQRLVSVGLGLRHVQHQLGDPSGPVAQALDQAVTEVAATIQDLRQLAHGLAPPLLDAGLAPAFRELARRSPVPVVVHVSDERFSRGVEAAAYFVGCEGLTNAAKHSGASRIELTAVRRDGRLVVSVTDDGTGGAQMNGGSGLRGLADRVAAAGGRMVVDSAQGRGTVLTAELPCGS
jgi:signal transduction histidine kinase